jgi:titin
VAYTTFTSTVVAPTATSYVDTKVVAHTTYYYRVMATNSGGMTVTSNIASATTPGRLPLAPSSLTGSAVVITGSTTQDKVTLNWVNNATNATGYTVQVSSSSSFATMTTYNVAVVTTYTQNVSKRVTLYYRVRATNADGVSTWSNTRTIITP